MAETKLMADLLHEYAEKLSAKMGHLQVADSVMLVEVKGSAGRYTYMVHLRDTPREKCLMMMEATLNEHYRDNPMPRDVN